MKMCHVLEWRGESWELRWERSAEGAFRVKFFRPGEDKPFHVLQTSAEIGADFVELRPSGKPPLRLTFHLNQKGVWVGGGGFAAFVPKAAPAARGPAAARASGEVRAPMTGRIVSVAVKAGERVAGGALLAVLEAMKMEYRLCAPFEGTVEHLDAEAGGLVEMGHVLVRLAPAEKAP